MVLTPQISLLSSVIGFAVIMAWRIRETRRAITLRKIVIPPLGMATGFSMFLVPAFRVPLGWALAAFAVGALILAWPLLRTSRLHRDGDTVFMRRSSAFFFVVIALAILRIAARGYLDHIISVQQTAGLFFVLAFGMILRWRMSMLAEYRRLTGTLAA